MLFLKLKEPTKKPISSFENKNKTDIEYTLVGRAWIWIVIESGFPSLISSRRKMPKLKLD